MSEEFVSKSEDPNINLVDIAEIDYIERQRLLLSIVERQIHELTNLNYNLFDDDDEIEVGNTILVDVLLFIDANYISIPGIETIILDPNTVSKIGRYAYELFTVELLNYIVPKMLLSLGLNDPTELIVLPYDGFKSKINQITLERLTSIKELYVKSGNEALYAELLKWTFYLDLFDANLENFIDRVIVAITNDYNSKIVSKLVSI